MRRVKVTWRVAYSGSSGAIPLYQRYPALELAPVGVVQCRPDDGMERDNIGLPLDMLPDNWLIPVDNR